MTKVETEWEVSPRPWKKIKRTYSSRTKGPLFREAVDHDNDGTQMQAKDAVIRLPLHMTADRVVCNDEELANKNGQHDKTAQRGPPRAPRGTSKNVHVFHGSPFLDSSVSTGLSNRRLIAGICKALEALLRATTSEKTIDNSWHRSLYSTCLRQIPSYISEEQRLTTHDDPENETDIVSEVYTDLEAFGSAPDTGWESLREVVRAHGVSLVGEAIQEGLIELPLSRLIVSLCLGLAAHDEAECVIESMVTLVKSRPSFTKERTSLCAGNSHAINKWAKSHLIHATPLTDEASHIVGTLKYYVLKTGRHGFMYRQTAAMLDAGVLPVEWISSKTMIECWNGVIRSVTQQDDHAQSAALLLQIAVSKSYRRILTAKASTQVHGLRLRACEHTTAGPTLRSYKSGQAVKTAVESEPIGSVEAAAGLEDTNKALQSTFSNILTVLSAINVLRSSKSGLDSPFPDFLSIAILQDMALEIHQALELAKVTSCANRRWSVPAEPLRLPLLSAGLVSFLYKIVGAELFPNGVRDLVTLASLPSSNESLGNAGSFLREIAHCCDEAGSGDGFRFIQIMVQNLSSIADSNMYDTPTRRLCSGIAHAAAFAFSDSTGQPKHLNWALDVEYAITRPFDHSPKIVVDKTPARAVMRNKCGYKWEEGICEWIAKTPSLALQPPTAIQDVGHDCTYSEAPKSTLVQAVPLSSGVSPGVTDQRLPRPQLRRVGRGALCDIENVKRSCSKSKTSERLLFIRVSPRPQKALRPQFLSKGKAANELDELSTPESSQKQPVALREIPNLTSGIKRNRSGPKYDNKVIGGYNLEMPLTVRNRVDLETPWRDTDDELGFP